MPTANPALQAFVSFVGAEKSWAELSIEREEGGFRLRHRADRPLDPERLQAVAPGELRQLAMFTETSQFRPLKSSPDLRRGWTSYCQTEAELWRAVQQLYPGSIPDWYAAHASQPPVTDYRPFTQRQTGMYRITQKLTDQQAAEVISAGCHPRFCLKQRLWTVAGLPPDSPESKCEIPCLEPCALLLELARKAVRIEQEGEAPMRISPSELQSFLEAVEHVLDHGGRSGRVGEISSPVNPRRLQLLLEKYRPKLDGVQAAEPEEEE